MGIDVSKDTLDVFVNNEHYKIQNNKRDIKKFIETKIAQKIDVNLCVLESTGGYEKLAIIVLNESGIPVHRAHPNKIHAFAKASGHFAKTDKLDSKLIARYGELIVGDQANCRELRKEEVALQELRSVQKDLEMNLHAKQCRSKQVSGKALDYTRKQIEFIKKQLSDIELEIEEVIANDESMRRKQEILISYKGVGKKTANSLIAELPELGSISNKAISSLVGVAPKTYESGKKIGKGHISGGRFFVRKGLYMAALVAAYSNNKMARVYQQLLAKGKAKKIALVAIMRKIVICLNAMVKNNKFYEI